jgi:hypothetical protein
VRRARRGGRAVDPAHALGIRDLLGDPGELGVARPRGRVVRAAVEREAGVALQVARLARLPHRPIHRSPSAQAASVPEIRGEPSARSVAIVLWVWASSRSRTSRARSGAAASNSDQLDMAATMAARRRAVHARVERDQVGEAPGRDDVRT